MTIEDFRDYCLRKKQVTEHFPFDDDLLVFKVCNKMFALASLSKWEIGDAFINLKCDADYARELRAEYDGIIAGYHMNKHLCNSVKIHNSNLTTALILKFIDHSYDQVINGLSRKQQELLK